MENVLKMTIMLKNSLMEPEIERQIHHSEKFLIDLDNLSSESSEEEDPSKSSIDYAMGIEYDKNGEGNPNSRINKDQ